MIIPIVKKEEKGSRTFFTDTALSICVCEEYADKACTALRAFLPQCSVESTAKNALITVKLDSCFAKAPESFCLDIREKGIVIGCADYLGLRNALAAFAASAICKGHLLQLHETHIEDAPTAAHRGVMLDLAGDLPPVEKLYNELILLAKLRMNRVQLYLWDRRGVALELDSLPESCRLPGAYSKQQMRKLCAFADALGLTVIPEFDMPAHSEKLLQVFETFRCDAAAPDGMHVTSVCTGEPSLYTLYESLIHEILEIFPGPYFHMGGDEVEMLDLNVVCLWDNCPKCRRLREENGLTDRQEQYYYFVRRIYEMVKKEGRTLIMWSDQLDCPRGAMLPKDILMQFWRVAYPSRGPYVGCSMEAQAAMGYTIINSFYPETYTFTGEDIIMSAESLTSWRWDIQPDCSEQYAGQIIGSELCAWGYTLSKLCAYMGRFFPSAAALMADKLWNNAQLEYTSEYRCALTRVLLGAAVPEGLDVFAAIGSVLPPADNKRAGYPERVHCSRSELENVLAVLEQPGVFLAGDAERAKNYHECIEYTLRCCFPDD